MSKADETLIDLGYEKMDLLNSEYYYNLQKNRDWIEFVNNSTIKVRADLTMQELEAINEKVKELRLDRRRR